MATLAFTLSAGMAGAQPYDVSWWTVDGGGAAAGGGLLALDATAGQPDAGGPFSGGPFVVHSGFWALAAGGTIVPQADLMLVKTDGQDPVAAGGLLVYTLQVTNLGPAATSAATVTDSLPPGVSFVSSTPGCAVATGIVTCALGPLAPNGSAAVTLTVAVAPRVLGRITNTAAVTSGTPDPVGSNDSDSEVTTVVPRARLELSHGSRLRGDLASLGGARDVDLYAIRQEPFASYEIVVDETSGDLGSGAGPDVDRVAADGSALLQSAQAVGSGPARSLRFRNETSVPVDDQLVRVRSASCTSDCGPDDRYRVRAWETTARVPRFNNAGSQVTVLLLQNTTGAPVAGTVYAWSPAGALAGRHDFALDPRALVVLGTADLAPGEGGSLTIAHDGPYGALAGKTVALEPATGFSFDSILMARPR